MKALVLTLLIVGYHGAASYGKRLSTAEIESLRAIDLSNRELKASKTSIVAYNKTQMGVEDAAKEAERIEGKCAELGSPCHVTNLKRLGVFEVEYDTPNHPAVDDLELDPDKETGVEDMVVHISNTIPPTDPGYSNQWAYDDNYADINIEEGWAEYLSDSIGGDPDGPSIIVAIVDTGIDYDHVDLVNMMWTNPGEIADNGIDDDGNGIIDDYYGADFTEDTSGTGDPIDIHGHGSHCAGIVAAEENNGEGMAGVASFSQGKVKLMAVKGLSDSGGGTISGLLAGVNYAMEMGARISSNSWGSGVSSSIAEYYESTWDQVLQNNPDHLFIAAAGNDATEINDDLRPMACGLVEPNLMCVASSQSDGTMSSFSNYGEDYIHVFAPGSSIYSTLPDDSYASWSGTSMATPMVSGLAALIMTMREDLTGAEVRAVIEANVETSDNYDGLVSSGGCIDVGATILALKEDSATTEAATEATTTETASTGNLYYVDDGCHSEGSTGQDDVIGYYEDESSVAAYVRCCSDDGTLCDTVSNCRQTSDLVAYADAELECLNNGMRLCTMDELLSDICCGTGGNCDSAAVWTSTLYEEVETNYLVDDGCQSEGATPDDYDAFYQPESSFAYVRCCSDDGSSCATPESCRDEEYLVTYADAETKCTNLGMRLCTWDELLTDICCGTGGSCDSYLVWTSTAE